MFVLTFKKMSDKFNLDMQISLLSTKYRQAVVQIINLHPPYLNSLNLSKLHVGEGVGKAKTPRCPSIAA